MWKKFCGFLLKALGWTADSNPVPEPKCIILGVPHTSIWDFVISYLYYTSVGGKAYVMIKKGLLRGTSRMAAQKTRRTPGGQEECDEPRAQCHP